MLTNDSDVDNTLTVASFTISGDSTVYTAGTSARPEDLRPGAAFPVFETGRGGQLTYHGPGQRIAYAMLDLRRRGQDRQCPQDEPSQPS